MPIPSRAGFAQKRAKAFMRSQCTIYRVPGNTVVYSGRCAIEAAEAQGGQLAEPDPVDASPSEYTTFTIYLPYPEANVGILEGDLFVSGTLSIVIVAVEEYSTIQSNIQLYAVKQRTSTERFDIVLYRDDDNGVETALNPQAAQIVLEGSAVVGGSSNDSGTSLGYIAGTMIFKNPNADVQKNDRFVWRGHFGEVTGTPFYNTDRKEVRIRLIMGTS